jgi:2,3-bisphosphoglycerate-independent phosphoglycerate mutase
MWSKTCLVDGVQTYTERAVLGGSLGTIAARDLLPIALAEAGRFNRYGA